MKKVILFFTMMLMFASCEKVECSGKHSGVLAKNHTPHEVILQDEQGNYIYKIPANSERQVQYFNGTYIELRNGQEIRYTIPYGQCTNIVINIF